MHHLEVSDAENDDHSQIFIAISRTPHRESYGDMVVGRGDRSFNIDKNYLEDPAILYAKYLFRGN